MVSLAHQYCLSSTDHVNPAIRRDKMKLQQDPVIALQVFVEREVPSPHFLSSSSKDHLNGHCAHKLLVSSTEDIYTLIIFGKRRTRTRKLKQT